MKNPKKYGEKLISVSYNQPFDRYPDLWCVLESGKSITAGLDYNRKNNAMETFNAKVDTVFRDENENTIPKRTSLNKKNSYLLSSNNHQFLQHFQLMCFFLNLFF